MLFYDVLPHFIRVELSTCPFLAWNLSDPKGKFFILCIYSE